MIKEPPAIVYKAACLAWLFLCSSVGMLFAGGVDHMKDMAARDAQYRVLIAMPLSMLSEINVREL